MNRRLSVVCWLWFLLFPTIGSIGLCQEDRTDATKRILLKMAVERAKLMQFECEVHVSTETPTHKPDFLLPQSVSLASFELYFSAIGQYWIQISKYKDPATQEDVEEVYGILSDSNMVGWIRKKEDDAIAIVSSDEPLENRFRNSDYQLIDLICKILSSCHGLTHKIWDLLGSVNSFSNRKLD